MGKINNGEYTELPTLVNEARRVGDYRPIAAAIIENPHGKCLLVNSAHNFRDWGFPQGGTEVGEHVETALFREINEEVGISRDKLLLKSFLGWKDLDAPKARADKRGFSRGKRYFFFHLNYLEEKELSINTAEVAHYSWVNPLEAELLTARTRSVRRKYILRMIAVALGK